MSRQPRRQRESQQERLQAAQRELVQRVRDDNWEAICAATVTAWRWPRGKGHPHKLVGTNPDGSIAFESEAYDGQVQWFHIPNGGFEPDGKTVLQEARHGGFNGNEFQFTEYLVELK